MRRKTIRGLMSDKKVVYVWLSNEKVAEAFFALAIREGFTLHHDLLTSDKSGNFHVRLNEDGSISYPTYHSWAGALLFHHAKKENGKKVVKYDFDELMTKMTVKERKHAGLK